MLILAPQHARRYATEGAPKAAPQAAPKGGSNAFAYAAGAAALGGAGYWYMSGGSAPEVKAVTPPKVAFKGGDQGFFDIKLAEVENVNHNTKRFRFELPEGDMESGLQIASAILTKYKGPNDEKATLRPYTPVSDEGKFVC